MARDQRLHDLVEQAFADEMEEQPEVATFLGWPGRHDRWTDWTPDAIAARNAALATRQQALHRIERGPLDDADRLTWDLFDYDLRNRTDGIQFHDELQPLNQLEGPQQDPALVLSSMPSSTDEDREDQLN